MPCDELLELILVPCPEISRVVEGVYGKPYYLTGKARYDGTNYEISADMRANSDEENRKMELMDLHNKRPADQIVECVDNDETAAVVSELMHSEKLILLTSVDGIMLDPADPSTLIPEVAAKTEDELKKTIAELQGHCHGASRSGANGAGAKLEYAMRCALTGTHVIIGSPRFRLSELIHHEVPCTHIYLAGGRKKP